MRISVFYGIPGAEGGVCAVINMFCYIEKGCCKMMISLVCNGLFFFYYPFILRLPIAIILPSTFFPEYLHL